jgi:hypothetical protein
MFYINRDKLRQVLFDYASAWAAGAEPAGPSYWPGEIASKTANSPCPNACGAGFAISLMA